MQRKDLLPPRQGMMLYVDESGTHGMRVIDPDFPVLTIAGCAFSYDDYLAFQNAVDDFKKTIIGDPAACIHSRDIRNWEGDFARVPFTGRTAVQAAISRFMEDARFTLITVTIVKDRLGANYSYPNPPYEMAIHYLLERYYALLRHTGMRGGVCPESRGKGEDATVADEYSRFRRVGFQWATPSDVQGRLPGPIVFGTKSDGCAGLEAADLSAYPVARYILNESKANPAFEILRPKFYAGNRATTDFCKMQSPHFQIEVGGSIFLAKTAYERAVRKYGLKVFP